MVQSDGAILNPCIFWVTVLELRKNSVVVALATNETLISFTVPRPLSLQCNGGDAL